ncbi:MAG: protein translocase subunit SecD [Ilumatobacter sp.]|uniref:protein translocase subunit SecD n=1 Tax=Ilumatobacter sp. TaxID=1967498 RepID=UPI00260D3FBE|nr:protein translocase subunit SecD [Ilumatobacter sp.]MDJ0767391.1 protein translocase subunit SecD [Ilumatobacter sp.]
MNKSALWASLVGFVALAGGLLALNLGLGNTPVLGLDLRGGVSVILAPDEAEATADDLGVIRDLVRDQLEATGIAEPDVRVEGENVIVDLPGVNDQEEALEQVSVSGIVTLRPVLTCNPGATADPSIGQTALPLLAGGSCVVGPSDTTGEVFERKSAGVDLDPQGRWVVNVDLSGPGEPQWNALAQQCFGGGPTCPSAQLAIVLDDVIQSAPVVQTADFRGSVQISGSFTEDQARSLADVLNRGAFPFQMRQERVETVSPTAGQDSLDAAIIAGLVGVAAVLVFMVAYYRRLAVIIVSGLIVWGATVFSIATLVSQATNYALTLAGATGIIVAVGVTVDTYVVLFERLRDEIRHGRSVRNAAPRSFQATWRTIVSADLVSLMASLILFWLSVGSVKGFALYLGLTTICDLLVCFFYTRPAIFLLSMTGWLDRGGRRTEPIGAPAGATP